MALIIRTANKGTDSRSSKTAVIHLSVFNFLTFKFFYINVLDKISLTGILLGYLFKMYASRYAMIKLLLFEIYAIEEI